MKQTSKWVLSNLGAIIVLVTVLWLVAKPHAEDFIEGTVKDHFNTVETKIGNLTTTQQVLVGEISDLKGVVELQTEAYKNNQEIGAEVLKVLRELKADQ